MRKLQRARKWAEINFTKDSVPDSKTLRSWLENGLLRGEIINGNTFIYEGEMIGVPPHVADTLNECIGASQNESKATQKNL